MKKLLSIVFVAALLLTACNTGDGSSDSGDVVVASHNSDFYEDIVFAQGGEFVGLNIGDSREEVMAKLPKEGFDDETESYAYYYWLLDNNDYYLDLYFEDDKLNSLDGYVYFYDNDSYYDEAAAKDFYTDLKADFVANYGDAEEIIDEDYTYTYWTLDDKDVEIGLSEGEVYWYVYDYSNF